MIPHSRLLLSLLCLSGLSLSLLPDIPAARAEKYQSRLGSLLLKKSDLYLPTRLVMGEEASFIVKAQPGHHVKLLISAENAGYTLPDGTPLRVGKDVQELIGVIPENGILELKLEMPKDAGLEGQTVYVEAVAGPSDESLNPIDIVDPTGRRTDQNMLVIVKPSEKGGPSVLPSMPGMSPQVFQQLTTMSEIYTNKDDARRQLLDGGDVNPNRQLDQNPFIQRGMQPGLR